MPQLLVAAAATLLTDLAFAHAGHGFKGPHWHASDLFGPAVMLGCAVSAFRMWRNKK